MGREVLEVEARRRIYQAIRREPGIHLRELARRAGVSYNLCDYHIQSLLDHEMITELEEGGYRMYYPAGDDPRRPLDKQEKRIYGFLRKRVPGQILSALVDGPMRHHEILERTDVTKSTLSYHLKRLTDADVVVPLEAGRLFALKDPKTVARLSYGGPMGKGAVESFSDAWESFYRAVKEEPIRDDQDEDDPQD